MPILDWSKAPAGCLNHSRFYWSNPLERLQDDTPAAFKAALRLNNAAV
jgi:hypothetical protein